ncbi:MAG: hypothetical protein K2O38_05470 [Muribaculaceae bacterium]|nr:hypothetical protein [Muribaculaceae bacterium]
MKTNLLIKLILFAAISTLSIFAFARQEMVIRVFSGGNVVREINSSELDYIEIVDFSNDNTIDSLLEIKKSGEFFSSTISIPPSSSDRKNVVLRVGLHYGNVIGKREKTMVGQSDPYNEVFFHEECEKDFSDIRFLSNNSVLKHRLEHHGNYEVIRDNSFNPGLNFGVDYETSTIFQGGKYTLNGGATWLNIPNWKYGNIVFVDSRKILYSFKEGKVFATPKNNGKYNGANSVEICDVTKTSTGNYSNAYPSQGSRAIVEDNNGYIYFGTNGNAFNAVIFRSINPDMTPVNGEYVKEVFSQEKVYKDDGSLDYEVVDQHIHNLYHHKGTNTIYAGIDNSMRKYGPRLIKTLDNGNTWHEVVVDSKEWVQQRGRDYIPSYISPDGSYMLGGGEVNILGGQTLCKVYNTVIDNKLTETSIKGIINNGTGLRNMSSFDENFIIAGLNAGSGGNSDIQLLLSEDKGESWKTIYSENVPLSVDKAGLGVRFFSEPFSLNDEEQIILVTGTGANNSTPFSPLVIYKGGSHYYGEAYVYVGDIPANETKTITIESGYAVQMPNKIREDRLTPVYHLALNEGSGDIVTDSQGNNHKIHGEYEWDSYITDVRFGGHWPIVTDGNGHHGLKLMDGAFIELGKVEGLDFNKGFTVSFWYKWDSDLDLFDKEYKSKFYDKIGAILSSDNYGIGLYRAGYIIGNIQNNTRGVGCRVIHKGMYEFVCISVTNEDLPKIVISRNDDYGKQTSVTSPTNWTFESLSDMNLRIGTPTTASSINYPIFIHSISIYDKVLTMDEVQSLYKGGVRL